jgi:hypothetical protein
MYRNFFKVENVNKPLEQHNMMTFEVAFKKWREIPLFHLGQCQPVRGGKAKPVPIEWLKLLHASFDKSANCLLKKLVSLNQKN